jgi:diguanylate cyclase (GGDEF)-like protein
VLLQAWNPTQQFLDALRAQFLAEGAIIFAFALLGGIIFSRRTSQPLREIAAAARGIAEGNLERRVPVRGSAEATTLAAVFNDMSTSLKGAQERLFHDAFHDHLTQLPNRALFMDRLQQAIARRTRHPEYTFAVLFIDLDRFKTVNDSIGHPAGDRLLLETASRLTAALRHQDTAARLAGSVRPHESTTLARVGGDEFTILLEDIRNPADAVRVAERLQQAVSVPVTLDGQSVFPTASIGIAVSSEVQRSGNDLVRDADLAMYRAKSAGGDRAAVFDATMHRLAVERLQLEFDLRRALDRGEFTLHYQPIVSLRDHRPTGFEALLRWQHPERGLLEPASFIKIAEETGLITRIDAWVLGRACADACRWQAASDRESLLSVSVNISGQGFGRPDLVQHVARMLQETGLNPHSLRLEITESVAMADAERARTILAELKALGVRISLDDFGTGYSSLSYLQRFPVDTLKIDRTFVAAMDQNEECREIIRTVLNLGVTLNLEVIAEGAETAAQVDDLTALACEFGQGYFFSRPLAVDQAIRFLAPDERVAFG